jgi:protein-disulfide isomerase
MAKKPPQRRKQQARETNWAVIGGLIAVGVIVFGGLLFLALRPSQTESVQALSDYCAENSDRCAFFGETDAPVTMVEVSDFGCTHCTDFHNETAVPLKEQHVDTGDVHWIALPYALDTVTVPAAAAAMCANEQDQYFNFANTLFGIEDLELRLSPAGYQQAAQTIGLDMDAFNSCMDDGRYISTVNSNRDAARANGVTGTPTFFLNGEKLVGAQPLSVFSQTIAGLLNTQ